MIHRTWKFHICCWSGLPARPFRRSGGRDSTFHSLGVQWIAEEEPHVDRTTPSLDDHLSGPCAFAGHLSSLTTQTSWRVSVALTYSVGECGNSFSTSSLGTVDNGSGPARMSLDSVRLWVDRSHINVREKAAMGGVWLKHHRGLCWHTSYPRRGRLSSSPPVCRGPAADRSGARGRSFIRSAVPWVLSSGRVPGLDEERAAPVAGLAWRWLPAAVRRGRKELGESAAPIRRERVVASAAPFGCGPQPTCSSRRLPDQVGSSACGRPSTPRAELVGAGYEGRWSEFTEVR